MKTLRFENIRLHIIIWTIFIAYEVLFVAIPTGGFANFWDYFVHYSLHICLFYFNAHIVLPFAFNNNKRSYVKLIIMVLGELAGYCVCKCLILYIFGFFKIPIIPPFKNYNYYLTLGIVRALYFMGLSTGYWFALSTLQNRKKIADLEKTELSSELTNRTLEQALLTVENAYLKSQVNPHFLLNTLSFLYNSVSKFNDQIADSFMALAEMMRYALTNAAEDGKVNLESEIEHVQNFIKLNQARFSQRLCIDFAVAGESGDLRIIPLVLITLTENIFKYGDMLDKNYPAKIMINIEDGNLTFTTQNKKKKRPVEKGYGIGIQNTKNRLAMYHKYELAIEDGELAYASTLKIWL